MISVDKLHDIYESAEKGNYARFLSDMYFLMISIEEQKGLAGIIADDIYDNFIENKTCIECVTKEEMVLDAMLFDGETRYNLVCPSCGTEYELD